MNVVAIIPARAGSKRIPNKNTADLDGRPLLAYTCEAALAAGVLSAVYVNTDSPAIAAVGAEHGAACPVLRPQRLAQDDTPSRDSNLFTLDFLARRGERYDAVMVLQPTSPLRTPEDIRAAWRLFEEHAPCAVVSVCPVAAESWLGRIGRDGSFERFAGETPLYRLNGAIYIHMYDDYVSGRPPRKTLAYPMPATRSVDIDGPHDLEYARFLLERQTAYV